uniref:Integrase n=2 Tax=unclassified Caudoviricetes TaxID=2788787 RepID=A0A8S5NIE1_9CAUD|nr:MAG TPA: Integrase [Siphoviridae sp. ctUF252]DAE01504.1 MAG TPA: Integrase [Siphoviridae sp. ctZHt25]
MEKVLFIIVKLYNVGLLNIQSLLGKRKTLKQKKNEKVSDFKKRFNNINSSINQGTYIEKSNDLCIDLIINLVDQRYEDGLISPRSYKRNKDTVNQIKKTCANFINKPIQKVTISDIQKSKKAIREYSNSVIDKIWAMLYKMFKIAVSRRIIMFNIMDDETLSKPISVKEKRQTKALTLEEQIKLEKVLKSNPCMYNDILLLQLYLGARIGEVLAISKNCINLKENTLTIDKTITRDENDKVILGEHTKTYVRKFAIDKGKRTIPMTPQVLEIIKKYINNKITNIHGLLFWDYKDNKFVTDGEINCYLKRLNTKYKITDSIHTHVLRHTFVTRCQENGMPLIVIQSLVGHVEGSTLTNDTYTHVSLEFMQDELNKIN